MANIEKITCDYQGCDRVFAYRIKGFNLCSKHCFDDGEFVRLVQGWYRKAETKPPEAPEEEECGYCGGTGEVACSSTNYMACPACSKGAVKEG